MITIDIDVKIEEILVSATKSGMVASFDLSDAINPKTRLYLKFYKKQIDYLMKQFYKVDREKMRDELRLEFLAREDGLRAEIIKEIQESQALEKKRMKPRGVAD